MEHFCTLFDSYFLPQGLALYTSLQEHAREHRLWVLCMDKAVEKVLKKLSLPGMRCISLEEIETPELLTAKSNRTRAEYCWTLTPFLPRKIMEMDPTAERVTYVDSDCWFMNDPNLIFKEMDDAGKDVLITPHDYLPQYNKAEKNGIFCVQFMPFKRTKKGIEVITWWQEKCLEWCYSRFEPGRFGDQKYLDQWPVLFSDAVHVLINTRLTIAPWNLSRYKNVSDLKQVGCMYHFHSLRLFNGGKVRQCCDYYMPNNLRKQIYLPYIETLTKLISMLSQKGIELQLPVLSYESFSRRMRSVYERIFKFGYWSKLPDYKRLNEL